jgi:hypothetical protein
MIAAQRAAGCGLRRVVLPVVGLANLGLWIGIAWILTRLPTWLAA